MQAITINDVMTYNRSAKSWTVDTGDDMPVMFGSGPRAKEAAKLAAIKTVNPALYRMARAVIEQHGDRVASRVWSACDLVLAGDVEPGEGGAMVRSQSNAFSRYQVTMAGRSCSCSCLDMGITLSNGTPVCKHILATVFQLNLARQAELEPTY